MDSTNSMTLRLPSAPHPGETVTEYLDALGWSQRELSRRSGLTPKTISEICSGKAPITPPTSLAFEKVLGRPAHFWLNLQRQHDENVARIESAQRSEEWRGWATRFPLKEMREMGFLSTDNKGAVESLLSFLGVSSPDAWRAVWDASSVAYRQTRRFETSAEAMSVWVRATEIAASQLNLGVFASEKLVESLETLRALTRKRVPEAVESAQQICAAAGVALVWVPQLPKTGISGCARWLNDRNPLIALSLRYKTDDQMWFTFFHELGHVLLHLRTRKFVLDNAAEDVADRVVDPEMQQLEDQANQFAGDTLLPPKEWASFVDRGLFTNESIPKFSEDIGVGPGIVVGRLQREGLLKPFQGNAFKQKLSITISRD